MIIVFQENVEQHNEAAAPFFAKYGEYSNEFITNLVDLFSSVVIANGQKFRPNRKYLEREKNC